MLTLHWKITSHWDAAPSYFLETIKMRGGKRGKMKVEGRMRRRKRENRKRKWSDQQGLIYDTHKTCAKFKKY